MTLNTIFLQILNMSFTAGIVIVFVLLVRILLKKAPKIFSYFLWSVVLFRLLCPVSVFSPFSVIPKRDAAQEAVQRWADDYTGTTRTYFDNTEEYRKAVEQGRIPLEAGEGEKYVVTGADGISEPKMVGDIVIPKLSVLWLVGMLGMLGYSFWTFLRLKHKLIGAVCVRENIYLSDYIATPFTLGIVRPKIYLPSSIKETEQTYIIKHEQTHIRRGDTLVKMAAFLTLTIHWFNPLVWIAFYLAGKDMEMSCDEAVMKSMEEDIRAEYSTSLFSFATGKKYISGTPLTFGGGDIAGRIKNVMNYKKSGFWVILGSAVLVAAAVLALLGDPKKEEPDKEPAEEPEVTVVSEETAEEEVLQEEAAQKEEEKQQEEQETQERISFAEDITAPWDEYYFWEEHEVGVPCDPAEEGWDLENIADARNENGGFTNWPTYGNYKNTYLLEQTENYTLYGKGDYESLLLEYEGNYAQMQVPFSSSMFSINVQEVDLDADGEKEATMILSGILYGTGYFEENLFVADSAENGELIVYQFLNDIYLAQLGEHFSYEKTEQGVQPMLDNQPAGPFVWNDENFLYERAYLGDVVCFDMQNDVIKLLAEIAVRPEGGAIAYYNGQNITATVEYQGGGIFTLSEFKSYNEDLDLLIADAVENCWQYQDEKIKIVELRYDSSQMNEEELLAVAVVIKEGDDSYDYAEVKFVRQHTDGIVNWKAEEVVIEK